MSVPETVAENMAKNLQRMAEHTHYPKCAFVDGCSVVKSLEQELSDCRESTRAGSSSEADYIDKLEARLAKAQELLIKWRRYEKVDVAFPVDYHQCADELEEALK